MTAAMKYFAKKYPHKYLETVSHGHGSSLPTCLSRGEVCNKMNNEFVGFTKLSLFANNTVLPIYSISCYALAINLLTAKFPGAHKQCYKILCYVLINNSLHFLETIHEKIPYAVRNPMV